jgi:hypothetical protein
MFEKIKLILFFFVFFSCKTKEKDQTVLFDKFSNCFNLRQSDTIFEQINYDTLALALRLKNN